MDLLPQLVLGWVASCVKCDTPAASAAPATLRIRVAAGIRAAGVRGARSSCVSAPSAHPLGRGLRVTESGWVVAAPAQVLPSETTPPSGNPPSRCDGFSRSSSVASWAPRGMEYPDPPPHELTVGAANGARRPQRRCPEDCSHVPSRDFDRRAEPVTSVRAPLPTPTPAATPTHFLLVSSPAEERGAPCGAPASLVALAALTVLVVSADARCRPAVAGSISLSAASAAVVGCSRASIIPLSMASVGCYSHSLTLHLVSNRDCAGAPEGFTLPDHDGARSILLFQRSIAILGP